LLNHHHSVGPTRDHTARGDCSACTGRDRDDWGVTAGDDFPVKRESFSIAITGAPRVRRTHGKAINVGPVERGCIDWCHDVTGEHTGKSIWQRHGLGGKRQEIQMALEAGARLFRRNNFKELFLSRGRTHA